MGWGRGELGSVGGELGWGRGGRGGDLGGGAVDVDLVVVELDGL